MKKILTIATMIICVSMIAGIKNKVKAQDVVVIVNNDNPIGSMKQIEAKLYYMKKIKKNWPGINVVIRPVKQSEDSDAKNTFLAGVLKMSESEIEGYFKQRQFANAEPLPASFSNDAQVIAYVSENKGAIGYISQSAYSTAADKVKAVFTL